MVVVVLLLVVVVAIIHSYFTNNINTNILPITVFRLKQTYTPEYKKTASSIFGHHEDSHTDGNSGNGKKKKGKRGKGKQGEDGYVQDGGCACIVM